MSESAAKQRLSIDLGEFERRLRAPSPIARSQEDPLAELARLVGGGAPFTASSTGLPKAAYQPRVVSPVDWPSAEPVAPPPVAFDPSPLYAEQPVEHDHFAADHASYDEQYSPPYEEEYSSQQPMDFDEDRPSRPRRSLYLMSAALVLVVTGIAATFAMRGHAAGGGEAPTIKADAGPTKIQPPAADGGVKVADRDASILDRSGVDTISTSRVVDRQEQPVDLQTIRPQRPAAGNATSGAQQGGQAGAPSAAGSAGYFPEPKRVHTLSVRPDGTIISEAQAPTRTASAGTNPPVPHAAPGAGSGGNPHLANEVAPPAASPATPKTTARVAVPPKATGGPAGSASDAPPVPPASIPSIMRPVQAAPVKPTRLADASVPAGAGRVLPASNAVAGGYMVQLAAPPSEQEAKETAARLEKKFATELGSRHTSIEKADSNGHTVYRVRVVGLASDDANVLCSKLKASGGACFVAHN